MDRGAVQKGLPRFRDAEELLDALELAKHVTAPVFTLLSATFDPADPDKLYFGLLIWLIRETHGVGFARDTVHGLIDDIYDAAEDTDMADGSGSGHSSQAQS